MRLSRNRHSLNSFGAASLFFMPSDYAMALP